MTYGRRPGLGMLRKCSLNPSAAVISDGTAVIWVDELNVQPLIAFYRTLSETSHGIRSVMWVIYQGMTLLDVQKVLQKFWAVAKIPVLIFPFPIELFSFNALFTVMLFLPLLTGYWSHKKSFNHSINQSYFIDKVLNKKKGMTQCALHIEKPNWSFKIKHGATVAR